MNIFLLSDTTTSSTWMMMGIMLVLIVGMYMFTSRSQKKRQEKVNQMVDSLRVGSKIKTIGGIHGEIVEVCEDTFVIKSGANGNYGYLRIGRNAIYAHDEVAVAARNEVKEVVEVVDESDEI